MPARKPKSPSALEDALKLIRRKPVTTGQLADHLAEKGHDPTAINSVARELTRQGLLDDRRFAEAAALTSLSRSHSTSHTIKRLKNVGVPPVTAARAARAIADDDGRTDHQRAAALARTRLRGPLANLPPAVQRRRLFALLARRGHDHDAAELVVNSLIPDIETDALPSERPPEEP